MDIADFSLDLFSLAGRNALVTGGNSGLGRAFSTALAKAGADVLAVGLAEDDGTTRRLIEGAGRRMEFMPADITQPGVPGGDCPPLRRDARFGRHPGQLRRHRPAGRRRGVRP